MPRGLLLGPRIDDHWVIAFGFVISDDLCGLICIIVLVSRNVFRAAQLTFGGLCGNEGGFGILSVVASFGMYSISFVVLFSFRA